VDDGALHPGARRLCARGAITPFPIVEPTIAAREAREKIWARRQELGFAELADAIQKKPRVTPLLAWQRVGVNGGAGRWAGSTNNQQLGLNLG